MLSFYKFCIHTCLSFVTKRMRTRSPSTNTPWWWTSRHLNWIRRENVFRSNIGRVTGSNWWEKVSTPVDPKNVQFYGWADKQTRTENSLGNIFKTCLRWILAIRLQSPKRETKIFCGIRRLVVFSNGKNYQTRETENQTNVFYANTFLPVWSTEFEYQ